MLSSAGVLPRVLPLAARLHSTLSKASKRGNPFGPVPEAAVGQAIGVGHDRPMAGIVLQGLGLEYQSQPQHMHPLVRYRGSYPEDVWHKIVSATDRTDRTLPVAIDIGVGTGRGAVELARRCARRVRLRS